MNSMQPDTNGSLESTFIMYTKRYKRKNIQIALQYEYTIYTIDLIQKYILLVINDKSNN